MKCLDCKFSEWKRTKDGKKHPSGDGYCKWKKEIRMPGCYRKDENSTGGGSKIITPHPSFISRKEGKYFIKKCDVYERKN